MSTIPNLPAGENGTSGDTTSSGAPSISALLASVLTLLTAALGPVLVPKHLTQDQFTRLMSALLAILIAISGFVIHRKQQANHQDLVTKLGEHTAYINLVSKQTTADVVKQLKSDSANQSH